MKDTQRSIEFSADSAYFKAKVADDYGAKSGEVQVYVDGLAGRGTVVLLDYEAAALRDWLIEVLP